MRCLHTAMSFDVFERLPRRVGWKYEYFDGTAHVTPLEVQATLVLDLAARAETHVPAPPELRPVDRLRDESALVLAFVAAFEGTPEYAECPDGELPAHAAEYTAGYFGDVRGQPWPGSRLVELRGSVIAAALVKLRRRAPLLDCIFVYPEHARRGWASALLAAVVRGLRDEGHAQLVSFAHLANEASLAWHARCGFREIPDFLVASQRANACAREAQRGQRFGVLSDEEIERYVRQAAHWHEQARRLRESRDDEALRLAVD